MTSFDDNTSNSSKTLREEGGAANGILTPSELESQLPKVHIAFDNDEADKSEDSGRSTSSEGLTRIVVDWEGENDPENPLNWSSSKRMNQVILISAITMLTSLGASMLAPGMSRLMKEFNTSNEEIGSLAVTIYLLGFAVGPLIIAPLSELYGRIPLYHACNLLWTIFTVACALSTNMPMFIIFRFLAGAAGSCPLTIGGGTVVDVMPIKTRGSAMSIFAVGPLLGPVVGPIAGGFLAQAEGWRWVFWVLTIAMGLLGTAAFFLMKETYAVVLLNKKAAALRKSTGNPNYVSKFETGLSSKTMFKQAIVRPFKMLFLSPVVIILSTYTALVFSYLFLLFTTFTTVFEEQYKWSGGISGLAYLGIGGGLVAALLVFTFISDWLMEKQTGDGPSKPEYRLPVMKWTVMLVPAGLFWYGWSAQAQTFWLVPILGTALIGAGAFCTFMPTQTYLVDCYGKYAASALAANTVLRSIFGCVLPLAGPAMYNALGLGWGNSLLACIAMAFAPVPFIFFTYGERIRARFPVAM